MSPRSASLNPAPKAESNSQDQRLIDPAALEKLRLTTIDLFAQGLFHQVGMREIAKRAQVGLATIYKYFGNKEELVFACIDQDLAELSQRLKDCDEQMAQASSRDRLKAMLDTLVQFYLGNRQIAEIVYLNVPARMWVSNWHPMQVQQVALIRKLAEQGVEKGEIHLKAGLDETVQLVLGAIFRYLMAYLLGQFGEKSPEQVSQDIFENLWPIFDVP